MIGLRDISFSWKGEEKLFSSLSLEMEEGEKILILSEPGSGKTTLAKILTGSVPKYFDGELSGVFTVGGKDIFPLDLPERTAYVARTSQNSSEMMISSTVEDEIAFPLEMKNVPCSDMCRMIDSLMERYDLEKYRGSGCGELSGGEKRRLSLAAIEAVGPSLYVFDEAFDELSSEWRARLGDIVKTLPSVIVMGSHYLPEYEGLFDRVLTIENGKLRELEAIPEIRLSFRPAEAREMHELRAENLSVTLRHRGMKDGRDFNMVAESFLLRSGELTALLGDNGSGKSTLSKVLTGLIAEKTGSVMMDGKKLSAKDRKKTIAYLSQDPYSQLYLATVGDELRSVTHDDEKIDKALELFGLDEESYTEELPYGMAKKLQAAVFWLLERPFVIFDEIDSALSYADTERVMKPFLDEGRGIMMITHDSRIKDAISGRRYTMEEGRLS